MSLDANFMAADCLIQVHSDIASVDASTWNDLLDEQAHPTPFMRHEYLNALELSGSAVAESGWLPRHMTLHVSGQLLAACAGYLKSHSYGEYVFDWAWADAYRRHGLRYYPKHLSAVPFTPVPGTRLMARDGASRVLLAAALRQDAQQQGLSSAHVLFIDDGDSQALLQAGWMLREGLQFHWTQDTQQPQADFADLLSRLQRDKRKKIQQDRRRVQEQGIAFSVHEASDISEELWAFFYHCYTLTYRAHQSTPYLSRDFFSRMAATMAEHWVMFVARRGDQAVACSLIAVGRPAGAAWGRYWGCIEQLPCLHFEACYYQPLAWCLANGFSRFEGGAQGEHKMARGLLPTKTQSAHWLSDPRFAQAVSDFLGAEGEGVQNYVSELEARSPFKSG